VVVGETMRRVHPELRVLAALVLAACGGDGQTFTDAGVDASRDAPAAPSGMLPGAIPLAMTDCGATGETTFTVTNNGTADLTYALALSDAAFTVTPASGTIVAGAATTFTVTVTVPADATAGQALTATLTATTNLPGSPHAVPITVTPRGAHITVTPPSVGFGQVEAGTTSAASTVAIANTGNAPATVAIAAPGGAFNRTFGTSGSTVIAGGDSAAAAFTYAPTGIGDDSGAAALTITGAHCGVVPTSIPLTGTGAVTGGVLVQNTPVAFGARACGSSASTATISLVNTAAIAAQFTATLLTDADGDHLRYTVSPASGSVPANDTVTLTITRTQIALPFQPRAVDATLRINVDLPTSTDTDVAVTQTLTGPFLAATPTSQDFGYAALGGARTGPVTISNTGNAAATLQATVTAPFSFALPAMVASGASGSGTMTFEPTALGTETATATITAPGACSGPVTFTFTAGNGPYVSNIYTYGAAADCPVGATISGPIDFTNGGNQALTMSCADLGTNDFAAQFTPGGAGPGSSGQVDVTVATGTPIRAGAATTTLRCTTNEQLGNTYDLDFTRSIWGADLALSATAPLDFTCGVAERRPYTITSAATSTHAEFVMPTEVLVMPLGHDFTQLLLGPGSSYENSVTTYGGGSAWAPFQARSRGPGRGDGVGSDPCDAPLPPGAIVFTGEVGIEAGSGTDVCSVTPSSLEVVLRKGGVSPE